MTILCKCSSHSEGRQEDSPNKLNEPSSEKTQSCKLRLRNMLNLVLMSLTSCSAKYCFRKSSCKLVTAGACSSSSGLCMVLHSQQRYKRSNVLERIASCAVSVSSA